MHLILVGFLDNSTPSISLWSFLTSTSSKTALLNLLFETLLGSASRIYALSFLICCYSIKWWNDCGRWSDMRPEIFSCGNWFSISCPRIEWHYVVSLNSFANYHLCVRAAIFRWYIKTKTTNSDVNSLFS